MSLYWSNGLCILDLPARIDTLKKTNEKRPEYLIALASNLLSRSPLGLDPIEFLMDFFRGDSCLGILGDYNL